VSARYGVLVAGNRVVLFTLGGTIAMAGTGSSGAGDGVVARLQGDELVAEIDGLAGIDIEVRDMQALPSAALSFDDVLEVVELAAEAVADGAVGVVLTQGTDTLEETAFLIDSVWTSDAPFTITGAMRNPTLPGADGPANMTAAVEVAASPHAAGRGALVVFDDEIHAARYVRKTHSSSTATFRSPDLGPIGHVVEGTARFLADLPARQPVVGVSRAALATTRVGLYVAALDDDGGWLATGGRGQDGLVVAGFGVGHVPPVVAPLLGELAERMPVVLTSRTGSGSVFKATYGAVGLERDLLRRGLVSGGFLHPYQARVLLRLLLASGADRDEIAAAFVEFG
jgi:L-asparaginase